MTDLGLPTVSPQSENIQLMCLNAKRSSPLTCGCVSDLHECASKSLGNFSTFKKKKRTNVITLISPKAKLSLKSKTSMSKYE